MLGDTEEQDDKLAFVTPALVAPAFVAPGLVTPTFVTRKPVASGLFWTGVLLGLWIYVGWFGVAWAQEGAGDLRISVSVSPEYSQTHSASLYANPFTQGSALSSRQDLNMQYRQGGWNAQGSVRRYWRQSQDDQVIAQQLYYDAEVQDGWGWTAGKKVMSWGVGFGFRPLDVIQKENRRGANPPPLVGVPLLALEHFTGQDALSLVWAKPTEGQGSLNSTGQSLAAHWYRLTASGDDVHGVLRIAEREQLQIGLGATRIIGEEWSLHGALLWQARHGNLQNSLLHSPALLATSNPMLEQNRGSAWQAVLGAQWIQANGWSVLLEGWLDETAYRLGDWRALEQLTRQQLALSGLAPDSSIQGNIAWSSQALRVPNVLQENLLLRVAYDSGDGFKPYGELLFTPHDRGHTFTLGMSQDFNQQRLSLGWRQMGGPSSAIYSQVPSKSMLWLEWRIALM